MNSLALDSWIHFVSPKESEKDGKKTVSVPVLGIGEVSYEV